MKMPPQIIILKASIVSIDYLRNHFASDIFKGDNLEIMS